MATVSARIVLAAAIVFLGSQVLSDATNCSASQVSVISSSPRLAERVCKTATSAQSLLEECGIPLKTPVLIVVIGIADERSLLGHFGIRERRIELLAPAELEKILDETSAYNHVPADELFDSIVVHELSHVAFLSTACGSETCLAGHEYIAFAMQLASLSERSRNRFLSAYPNSSLVDLAWFSDEQLMDAPELFAANAWRHFSLPNHGCDFVGAISTGEVVFSSEYE